MASRSSRSKRKNDDHAITATSNQSDTSESDSVVASAPKQLKPTSTSLLAVPATTAVTDIDSFTVEQKREFLKRAPSISLEALGLQPVSRI